MRTSLNLRELSRTITVLVLLSTCAIAANLNLNTLPSCCNIPGDADHSGSVNIGDVTFLIARIFGGGPAPECQDEGDADGSNSITIGDVTHLIAYIFCEGPAPVCDSAGTGIQPGAVTQITTSGYHPTVSPDGLEIAYMDSGAIFKNSVSGGVGVEIYGFGLDPDWSWVHDRIVVIASGMEIFNPHTGVTETTLMASHDRYQDWSPLGDEIAVEGYNSGLLIIDYPSSDTITIPCTDTTSGSGGGCSGRSPTWSPDGLWLAFDGGAEILKVPRSGGTATLVAFCSSGVLAPAWSPDGQWIAFPMADTVLWGDYSIWVIHKDGMDKGLYRVTGTESSSSPKIDDWPAWSPDSKYIYFQRAWLTSIDPVPSYDNDGIWRVEILPK